MRFLPFILALLIVAGCATNKRVIHRRDTTIAGPPAPPNVAAAEFTRKLLSASPPPPCTNCPAVTNIVWSGKTTITLDTKTSWKGFSVDTNHVYSIARSATANGTYAAFTNVIGGATVTDSNTNQNQFYRIGQVPGFVVWAAVVRDGPVFTTCLGGNRQGYVLFGKPPPDWGWVPDTNDFSAFTLADVARADTRIQYASAYGQTGCGNSPLSFSTIFHAGLPVPPFEFTIYFSTNIPTGQYPILITGFNP